MSVMSATGLEHIETYNIGKVDSDRNSPDSHKMRRGSHTIGDGDNQDSYSAYSDSFDDSDPGHRHFDDYKTHKSTKKSNILKRANNGYGSRNRGTLNNHKNRNANSSKISPRRLDEVARNIMQTSELKINDLKNENEDLKRQINSLTKELKTQQRQNKLQGKHLDKVTSKEAEVPSLVARYNGEVQALQEQLRRQKEKNDNLARQNKELDFELSRLRKHCNRLKDICDNKQLGERDTLSKQVSLLESRLELEEKNRTELERNMELLNKNHRHELNIEIHRSKDIKQKLKERDEQIRSLENSLKEKTKQLEMQHIYSQRVVRGPHRIVGNQTGDEQALVPMSAESNHSSSRRMAENSPTHHTDHQKNSKKKDKLERSKSLERPAGSSEKKMSKVATKSHPVTSEQTKVSLHTADSKRTTEKFSRKEPNLNYSMELPEIRDSDDSMWSQLEEMSRKKEEERIDQEDSRDREVQERLHREEMDRLNKEKEEANQRLKELEGITASQRKLEDEERKRKDKLLDTLRRLDLNSDPSSTLRPNSKTNMKTKPIEANKHIEAKEEFPWSFSTYDPSTPDLVPKSKPPLPNSSTKPSASTLQKSLSFSDTDDELDGKKSSDSRSSNVVQGHPGLMASSKRRGSFGSGEFKSSITGPALLSANNSAMNAPPCANSEDDDDDIEIEELRT